MKYYKIKNWKYNRKLEGLLYFFQRMNEMLFHYSLDTYRYTVLDTRSLAHEYCKVYLSIEEGVLDSKNEVPIHEELIWSLNENEAAISILSKEYVDQFLKELGSMTRKQKFDNIEYIYRRLSNRDYFEKIVEFLRIEILKNKSKERIGFYSNLLIRELINRNYDADYIYFRLQTTFLTTKIVDLDSFDIFISFFDFKTKRYNVYLIVPKQFAQLLELIKQNIENISVVPSDELPKGIKLKDVQNEILVLFKDVDARDEYKAYDSCKNLVKLMTNFYTYYRHLKGVDNWYGRVECPDGNLKIIKKRIGGLERLSAKVKSEKSSYISTKKLFNVATISMENLYATRRFAEIHNAAIHSSTADNALLDFWSLLELMLEHDMDSGISRIMQIISYVTPFLRNNYIYKIVNNLMNDIKAWNTQAFNDFVVTIPYGKNDLEKTFAFISFDACNEYRDKIFQMLDEFPLLKNRIYNLNQKLSKVKHIKKMLNLHEERMKWHLQRIYRARNSIIHDGETVYYIDHLVENLHSYVDIICDAIISSLSTRNYVNSIREAIIEETITASTYNKYLDDHGDDCVDESNFSFFLYSSVSIK